MPLVSCLECGQQVSTLAAACPQCGAPRPTASPADVLNEPVSRAATVSVLILLAVVVAMGVVAFVPSGVDTPHPAVPVATLEPAPPASPSHYYTWHRNGFYGYEFVQSEFGREHGQAPPAITYLYEGQRGDVFHLRQFNGRFIDSITCRLPCETVHIVNAQVDQDLALRPQTALWAAVRDMVSGQLEPTR